MSYDTGLAERVRAILSPYSGFSECKMFGGVAFLMNGHMCCGVTKTDLVLRLAPSEVTHALRRAHTRPMDFTGKPMKSMIFIDAQGSDSDDELLEWVDSAYAYVRTLPSKQAKAKSGLRRGRKN